MYLPSHFAETRPEILRQFIDDHPFATLVTLGAEGLTANHIPIELDLAPAPGSTLGILRGHVARANPVWRDHSKTVDALIVFQGPQAYISPSWYPSKREHGKVVPTYNYMVVHAYGPLNVIDDRAWLRGLVQRLTLRNEASMPAPWKVGDAPADYIEQMLSAIVGLEIPLTRLNGKWKLSQNRSVADREGVIRGLEEQGDAAAT